MNGVSSFGIRYYEAIVCGIQNYFPLSKLIKIHMFVNIKLDFHEAYTHRQQFIFLKP